MIDFEKITRIDDMEIEPATLVFTEKVREWCKLPYPGYKHGCPSNCEARNTPTSEWEKRVKNNHDVFTLVWIELDFAEYKRLRKMDHENWSERMLGNSRHWQNSVKSLLSAYLTENYPLCDTCASCLGAGSGLKGQPSMEACGIFVFNTLVKNGIKFEKKPMTKDLMVTLVMENSRTRKPMTLDKFFGVKT